jgi:hypothetical protein
VSAVIETTSDLRSWFRERLEAALENQRVEATVETRAYLVELLTGLGVGRRRAPGEVPLALQFKDALEARSGAQRLRLFRMLGDEALCLSGFFSDHLEWRGLSPEYVQTMGGGAYETAGALAEHSVSEASRTGVYRELAQKFPRFAEVLDEVRERTALRTPQDIVKLYDKWRRTRSRVIAERLYAQGVVPIRGPGETIH